MFTSTSSTQASRAVSRTFRWIVVLPVLLVGSMLYWSVAIGLGGFSLMAASALSVSTNTTLGVVQVTDTAGASTATLDVGDGTAPLLIHLEESAEPEDVNDNVGAAGFTPTADDQQALVAPGPGATSY